MKGGHPRRNLWRRRRSRALRLRYGGRRRLRWRCRGCGFGLGADCMPRLRGGRFGGAGTQLLARGLTGPCTGINVPHDTQPFLGLRLAGEKSHVQTEALATLLEPTTDEEGEALELRQVRLRERHRRRRRAQIEDERSCLCSRSGRRVRVRLRGRQICRRCHRFPGTVRQPLAIGYGPGARRGMRAVARARERGSPAVLGTVL
jgi:hypothetical protein